MAKLQFNQMIIVFILVCLAVSRKNLKIKSNTSQISSDFNSQSSKLLGKAEDAIIGEQYIGEYTSFTGSLFGYINSKKGTILAVFYGSPNRENLNSLEIEILDPYYQDQRIIIAKLQGIININESDHSWKNTSHTLKYWEIYKLRQGDQMNAENISTTITFTGLESEDYESVQFQISMKSDNFQWQADFKYNNQILSTMGYSFFISFIVGVQIYSAFVILRMLDGQNPALVSKISLLTLSLCNIQDFNMTMTHIEYIMSSSVLMQQFKSGYLFFIFPSMAYIILFVVFDMKMLFLVWRSHNSRNIENAQMMRKKLTAFYIQFCTSLLILDLGLFIYLTLSYFFTMDGWFIIIRNLIIIPQIIHNVRIGNNCGFSPYYIFGYLGMRILVPIYERSCPQNRFNLAPDTGIVVGIIVIYFTKVLLIYLQFKLGSRFFVPKRFLPNYFQYKTKIKLDQTTREYQCTICLQSLFSKNVNTSINQVNSGSLLEEDFLSEITVMNTPCNHKFHEECLKQWMDVKLQCPTCRTMIPAL